ncbi:glycosyltransferase family 2 protein [Sphingobacterium suaedae]|uniref:Glycosyltransferase family 2 protein n=1 Tax=Sphingobacterium suaedae TaxID=1686402 RepID=A0ABW5KJ14_9SPHI
MKLTIVTINLNNMLGLAKTLMSIQSQTTPNFEYIIIDGGSTDGSVDLIRDFSQVNHWVSEKDAGVYDAMNKGIKIAKGDYILFLNSGDTLFSSKTLENVLPELGTEDIIYGNLLLDDKTKPYVYHFPPKLSFKYLFHHFLGHPSTFIKKNLFERFGYYETIYKIVADWAFMVRVIAKENVSTRGIDQIISIFDMNGMSADPKNTPAILEERETFLQQTFPLFYDDYLTIDDAQKKLDKIRSSKGFKLLKAIGVKKFQ